MSNKKDFKGKYMESKESKIIEQLFRLVTELDARERSSNLVIQEYRGTGWKDLCDIGIELFEQLKA